jgi:hypothetical protein
MSVPVRRRMINTYQIISSTESVVRVEGLLNDTGEGNRGELWRKVVRTGQGYAAGKVIPLSTPAHRSRRKNMEAMQLHSPLLFISANSRQISRHDSASLHDEARGGLAKLWRFVPQPDAVYEMCATIIYTFSTQPTVDTFSATWKHIRSSTFGCYSLRSGGLAKPNLHR